MSSAEDLLTRHWSRASSYNNDRPHHALKFFNPRWRKTQVALFSSCVNNGKEKTSSDSDKNFTDGNNNVIMTAPKIIANGGFDEQAFPSRSPSADLSVVEESEKDGVFLSPERRASEPINTEGVAILGSFGRRRPRQLNRSLSTGVVKENTRPEHQHKKLTKSVSSDATCRGANAAPAVAFNFSPEFVRKTSLRNTLHDWLGSHKVHMPNKAFRRSKRSSSSSSGDSKTGDVTILTSDGKAGQNSTSSPKHVYRRFSADSLQVDRKKSVDRRPSAPPSLAEGGQNVGRKSVEVRTMTSPQTIRHAAIVTCCDTDTKYANLLDFHLHCVIKEELRTRLSGLCFSPNSCRSLCEEISEEIKARVQLLCATTYKVICTVYIGALRDFGLHSASQALLDCKMDHHASASYRNKSLFAVASVFAVRYRSK